MSDSPNIDRLRDAAGRVYTMLKEPEPGLATWHLILGENAVALRDLLLELFPLERKAGR